MPKQTTAHKPREKDLKVIHDFALSLERGRFTEYAEILMNTRRLLWKSFVAGLGRGFGAIIGATVFIAILVAFLTWAGDALPDPIGDLFQSTSETIQQNPSTNP